MPQRKAHIGIEPDGPAGQFNTLFGPAGDTEHRGQMNQADCVVGVEFHTAFKVRNRHVVLVTKSVDLSEERVTSAFAWIHADGGRGNVQCTLLDGIGAPLIAIFDHKRQSQVGMGQSVARIEGHGLLEQFPRKSVVVRAVAAQMLDTAQQAVIGWQAVGPLGCGRPDFGVLQPARHSCDDGLRQFVLNVEKLLDAAIETLAPQMVA